jgi:hypothetical protein
LFKSRVLSNILGAKREEVGGWRKLHSGEPHDLYSSPNIRVIKSRKVSSAGHIACMAGKGNECRGVLCGKPDGKKPFGRPSHEWGDHMKLGLKEIGWEGVDWIYLAQAGRQSVLVNVIMNLQVPWIADISLQSENLLASQEGL